MHRVSLATAALVTLVVLAGCGGTPSSETQPTTAVTASVVASEAVSRETALAWPKSFCKLRTGMTRQQVRTIMGPPTSEFLDGKRATPQDNWDAYQFKIAVFYEDRAQVTDPLTQKAEQLGPDMTGALGEEDKKLFPCGAEPVFS